MRLPLTTRLPQPSETFPKYETPEITVSGGRALVVDDETELIKLQTQVLIRLGFKVEGVTSGDLAVAYLKNHEVDIIISDARMPGEIDGIDLYRWVLVHRPGLTDRFVLTTGDLASLEGSIPQGLRCITKPFTLREFRQVVQEVMERKGS